VRHKGGGFYKHPPPRVPDHDQGGPLKLRTGPLRLRKEQPQSTVIPVGGSAARPDTPSISFAINAAGVMPVDALPAEPSEASDGKIVVYTTNDEVGFSVNGGASFTSFTPASLYKGCSQWRRGRRPGRAIRCGN
jgi:hypothetical protein